MGKTALKEVLTVSNVSHNSSICSSLNVVVCSLEAILSDWRQCAPLRSSNSLYVLSPFLNFMVDYSGFSLKTQIVLLNSKKSFCILLSSGIITRDKMSMQ